MDRYVPVVSHRLGQQLAAQPQNVGQDENGRNYADYCLKYDKRIRKIAASRSAADTAAETAQQVLAALYHPLPFAPAAIGRALNYAVAYTAVLVVAVGLWGFRQAGRRGVTAGRFGMVSTTQYLDSDDYNNHVFMV